MKQLLMPNVQSKNLFENITSLKNIESRIKLDEIKPKIIERYKFYEDNSTNLENIIDTSNFTESKNLLKSCYGDNLHFNEARRKIREVAKGKCPFCGIGIPSTIDHYFCQDQYPEFSIFLPNLVPCCWECNTTKGVKMVSENSTRKFIHFYFDNLPIEKFLFIEPEFDCGIPMTKIRLNFNHANETTEIIKNHFTALKLIQKYKETLNEKLDDVVKTIIEHSKTMTIDEIRETLRSVHRPLERKYGANFWETCLYDGVINKADFIESVIENSLFLIAL